MISAAFAINSALGRNHGNNGVSFVVCIGNNAGNMANFFSIRHGTAAEFLYDQSHISKVPPLKTLTQFMQKVKDWSITERG